MARYEHERATHGVVAGGRTVEVVQPRTKTIAFCVDGSIVRSDGVPIITAL